MVVTAAATAVRDLHWLKRNIAPRCARPDRRHDQRLCRAGRDGAEQPRLAAAALRERSRQRGLSLRRTRARSPSALHRLRATRISYMGELGWELYVPSEFAIGVLRSAAGRTAAPHGLKLCGMHAMDSLRIEKAYRHWGHDITDEDTPLEAGLGFAVAFDKNVPFHRPRRAAAPAGGEEAAQAPGAIRPRGPGAAALSQRADLSRRQAGGPHQLGQLRPSSRPRHRHGLCPP